MGMFASGQIPLDPASTRGVTHVFDQTLKEAQSAEPAAAPEFHW